LEKGEWMGWPTLRIWTISIHHSVGLTSRKPAVPQLS
jgi:hypothetical protein